MLNAEEPQPAADEVTPDQWPRTSKVDGTTYTMYQPQMDSWDGYLLKGRSAVSVQPPGTKGPIFGVFEFATKTLTDRVGRTVLLQDLEVTNLSFPSAPNDAAKYRKGLLAMARDKEHAISLDRLEAMLAIEGAEEKARAVPVRNDPPKFIFSQRPAILFPIDGEPIWRSIEGTTLDRVINTRTFIALDNKTGTFYMHLFDGFVSARSFSGPWVAASGTPQSVVKAAQSLAQQGVVDLMAGEADETSKKKPTLAGDIPQIIVSTVPTELIMTQGAPDWLPVAGTSLLFVKNTTANIFKDLNDQRVYVLVTGRWFRANDFAGPWQYVSSKELPADFARIPDDSPKENVKASVAGTPQAQEAVIAADIPQTAKVYRSKVSFTSQIDGSPVLKPIPDTPLMYVYNSPQPIIMVDANQWYSVQNGVWFTAASALGPWTVATSIPAVIYSIPASSPLHYVTYVKIYETNPDYVVAGYTPGYTGTVIVDSGVVVYGTGYPYVSYVGPSYWYPSPVTYGYAASVSWTPWTGWAFGFGFGWGWGFGIGFGYPYAPAPYWGAMPYAPYGYYYPRAAYYPRYGGVYPPYRGAVAWGPRGWAATSGNVYNRYGSTAVATRASAGYSAWSGNAWSSKVGTSYNSTTGRISAGQRASVSNVYTGNYASGQRGTSYNPTTGVATRGGAATVGNVYTGNQKNAAWGKATGPGGQSVGAARVNGNYYASHDGNIYKNTGSGWQKYEHNGWNSVQGQQVPRNVRSQQSVKSAGDSRSAGSSWGSSSWGGGFNRGAASSNSGMSRSSAGSAATTRSVGTSAGPSAQRSWGGGSFGGGSFGGGSFSGGGGRNSGGGFSRGGGGGRR